MSVRNVTMRGMRATVENIQLPHGIVTLCQHHHVPYKQMAEVSEG